MTSSIENDPTSSWNAGNEATNASGTTFSVKFMGFVPVLDSIQRHSSEQKDNFVKFCITTVVTSRVSDQFNSLLTQGIVGPFVSVYELNVFLNIANFTITFFHIIDGRTHLLGRYMNDQMSYYKTNEIDDRLYIGMVMKTRRSGTRECNVFMLDSKAVSIKLQDILKKVDNIKHLPVAHLESRMRSTQEYAYKPQYLSCFHGRIDHQEACSRLLNIGDFLIRDSSIDGKIALTFQDDRGSYERTLIPNDNINFFKQFQLQKSPLRNAIVRPDNDF